MIRRRGVKRLCVSALALAIVGAGCSLIVSGDVPEFQCVGTDPSACPKGMSCDTARRLCVTSLVGVDASEASDEDAPIDEDVRDAAKEAEAGGPADLGAKCRIDADCKSRMCGASTTLTTAITQTTGPICTTPCCTSGECPSTFVCFNGNTGGGYCVPATLAQRMPPAAGGKSPGAACTANNECRSGLCTGTPKLCLDTCCTANDCGGTTTCRLNDPVSLPGPTRWVCAPAEPGATKLPGDACADSSECASDSCIGFGASRICRPSCSNSASCKTVAGFASGHCLYTTGTDIFRFCFSGTVNTRSAAGVACTDPSTCQSDYCDAELKKCANVCGKDSDCAANESCRPSAVNTPYLRCVPKP